MTSDNRGWRQEGWASESRATRRRGLKLEDAILDAAWDVLIEHGYPGFSYEAVASRAGTSRPVLYRHWPQRKELLLAAIKKFWHAHPIKVPDTGNLRDDAIGLLQNADIGRARMLMLTGLRLTDFFRQAEISFSEFRASLAVAGEPTGCEAIVIRAIERGELASITRPSRVVNLPLDLYRHDVFMTMHPVADETILEIVDLIWLPLLALRVC